MDFPACHFASDEDFAAMSMNTNEFLKLSSLDILIPRATRFDTETLTEYTDVVASLAEQRSLLYFGTQQRRLVKAPYLTYSQACAR